MGLGSSTAWERADYVLAGIPIVFIAVSVAGYGTHSDLHIAAAVAAIGCWLLIAEGIRWYADAGI